MPDISLKQVLAGNTWELAYYCSEAYFVGIITDAPKECYVLASMMIEQLHLERYWEIDLFWINSVKLQIERIREMKVE